MSVHPKTTRNYHGFEKNKCVAVFENKCFLLQAFRQNNRNFTSNEYVKHKIAHRKSSSTISVTLFFLIFLYIKKLELINYASHFFKTFSILISLSP